jgi:hypothetical protein
VKLYAGLLIDGENRVAWLEETTLALVGAGKSIRSVVCVELRSWRLEPDIMTK